VLATARPSCYGLVSSESVHCRNMTTQHEENVVATTGRVYRILFVDGQVLDFVVEVRLVIIDCKNFFFTFLLVEKLNY